MFSIFENVTKNSIFPVNDFVSKNGCSHGDQGGKVLDIKGFV